MPTSAKENDIYKMMRTVGLGLPPLPPRQEMLSGPLSFVC